MSYMEHIKTQVAPRIAVFGVGGAGGNGLSGIATGDLTNIQLIAANTDAQALRMLPIGERLQLGRQATRGLGAGARPDVGRVAAQEAMPAIDAALEGVDFCFITAGMGGGTGTGAAPIFAEAARRRGIPTIAVVTRPFDFEGGRRAAMADSGLATLEPLVDALVVVPNQRLLGIGHASMTFRSAMDASNEILADTVSSVAQLLVGPALKRVGLAEIANVICEMGRAVIGFGECGIDPDRGIRAAARAMDCPLMDDEIRGAAKLIVSVTGGRDLGLLELDAIVATIAERASAEVELAWGASITERDDGVVRVALIAQGQRTAGAAKSVAVAQAPTPLPSLAALAALRAGRAAAAAATAKPVAPRPAPVAAMRAPEPLSAAAIAKAPPPRLPPIEETPLLAALAAPPPNQPAATADLTKPVRTAPIELAACTLDELWLGDFLLDDPRRVSLSDQLGQALNLAWRRLRRLYQRLTHARHSFIDYQPPIPSRAG